MSSSAMQGSLDTPPHPTPKCFSGYVSVVFPACRGRVGEVRGFHRRNVRQPTIGSSILSPEASMPALLAPRTNVYTTPCPPTNLLTYFFCRRPTESRWTLPPPSISPRGHTTVIDILMWKELSPLPLCPAGKPSVRQGHE